MSASASDKMPCAACHKSYGIFICQGCDKMFCGKHSPEHRKELNRQLEAIVLQHDKLHEQLSQPSTRQNSIFEEINKWEKDSIEKIQAAAETARKSLEESFKQSRDNVTKACHDLTEQLRTSHEADDFTEKELERWKKQLEELSLEFQSAKEIKLKYNRRAPVYLIQLQTNDASETQQDDDEDPPLKKKCGDANIRDRFSETFGLINIRDDGACIACTNPWGEFSYVRGQYLYSSGSYVIRFQVEFSKQPYSIFLGCISSKEGLSQSALTSPSTAGWFRYNQVYQNGRCRAKCQRFGYKSTEIQTEDILRLMLDCTSKEIRLHNERLGKTYILAVDVELAPFPWQFLVGLCNNGDSVYILPNL